MPIGVAHDPDGSIWTVYRARQSAPYTYAVEHGTTAPPKERARRLDYGHIDYSATHRDALELQRRNPLPSSLDIDGKIWTIHRAEPRRNALGLTGG